MQKIRRMTTQTTRTSSRVQMGHQTTRSSRKYSTVASGSFKKTTLLDIRNKFTKQEPIVMVTSYDYTSTQLIEKSEAVDAILVGDSLGMVMQGHSDTSSVTMDDMIHHCKAVAAASKKLFVVGDMPLGSYEVSDEDAVRNAVRLIKEGRVHAVKLEGGKRMATRIQAITNAGIPVMGHIGLTPQSQSALGGFRVQGRTAEDAARLVEDAKAVEAAGCFAVVIESVPDRVAEVITAAISIPTIGIGAGNKTSGQILVWHDMFGLFGDFQPKFSKVFKNVGTDIITGLQQYKTEVSSRSFPGPANSYTIKDDEWKKFQSTHGINTNVTASAPGPLATGVSIKVEPSELERRATKKIAVVGGGAMGSLFAAHLASMRQSSDMVATKPEIWVVSGWKDHVNKINSHGLELETQNGDVKLISGLKATTDPNECISDATNAKILLGDEKGFALTLQNGLGNREILVDALGEHRVLQGVTNHGAMAVEPGRVKHTGVGPTLLASAAAEPITAHLIEASAALKEIAALFNASGISTETMLGIERVVWGKLVVNAAVNPVTAIMGVTNGQALQLPEVYKLIHSAVNEACSVAKARGIQLPWSNPADVVVEVLQKTAANRSSMLQDVMRGEETEIDAINGAIIREAEKLGVSVPINEMLRDVIKSPSNMAKFRSQVLVGGFRL